MFSNDKRHHYFNSLHEIKKQDCYKPINDPTSLLGGKCLYYVMVENFMLRLILDSSFFFEYF